MILQFVQFKLKQTDYKFFVMKSTIRQETVTFFIVGRVTECFGRAPSEIDARSDTAKACQERNTFFFTGQ